MRRRRHHYRSMGALGEPITLGAAALWAIGGFVLAKIVGKKKDTLTPESIERAQVLSEFLKNAQSMSNLPSEADLQDWIDRNPDLLNAALYKSGVAPTREDLINEIRAMMQYVRTTGRWLDYSVAAKTLQGIPLYGRGFGAVGRR